jgi:hypothetical protein
MLGERPTLRPVLALVLVTSWLSSMKGDFRVQLSQGAQPQRLAVDDVGAGALP